MPPRTGSRRNRRPLHLYCFHAAVEVLAARRLMAASITGTPNPLSGNVGSPLTVVNYEGGSVGLYGPSGTAVSSPLPLIALERFPIGRDT